MNVHNKPFSPASLRGAKRRSNPEKQLAAHYLIVAAGLLRHAKRRVSRNDAGSVKGNMQ